MPVFYTKTSGAQRLDIRPKFRCRSSNRRPTHKILAPDLEIGARIGRQNPNWSSESFESDISNYFGVSNSTKNRRPARDYITKKNSYCI